MTLQRQISTNVLTGFAKFHSLHTLDLSKCTKDDMKAYFENTYSVYEHLFSSIKFDAAFRHCPDRLRLPLIFYYGHTAVVYMNKLVIGGLVKPEERIDLYKEIIYETGVDEMSWDDLEHYRMGGDYVWPNVEETKEYRRKVKELVFKVIERTPLDLPITMDSPWWALMMGMEHERIHYETSSVLIRQYPTEMVRRPVDWTYAPLRRHVNEKYLENEMVTIPATDVTLGKPDNFPSYGWDNEYGRIDCRVTEFKVSKFKITNEEFLEFVLAGGYERQEFWLIKAWEMLQFKQSKHPLWWRCPKGCKNGCGSSLCTVTHCPETLFTPDEINDFDEFKKQSGKDYSKEYLTSLRQRRDKNGAEVRFPYKYRLMFDDVEMPYNWPVEINYHEARAYCKWKGLDYRVVSEAEHHAMRDGEITDLNTSSDIAFQDTEGKVNHNLVFGSSSAVDSFAPNSKGIYDVYGNVWEWCEDHFNGLQSKTHYLYDDFSSPCYDGRHNLIMGGSWASTGDETSQFARFMFRRHFHQHCGFRVAFSTPTPDGTKANPQFRFVADRVQLIDGSVPATIVDLDREKLEVNFYPTTNKQYLYDSHLHPELFTNELKHEYDSEQSKWFAPFVSQITGLVDKLNVNRDRVVHFGAGTGRVTFELTKLFKEVIGVDYSSKYMQFCLDLQKIGITEVDGMKVELDKDVIRERASFVQFTWIAQEITASDLVLFTMIDRVMLAKSWLVRLIEIVRPGGLLVIHSREGKFSGDKLKEDISHKFNLVKELQISEKDSFTVWNIKKNEA